MSNNNPYSQVGEQEHFGASVPKDQENSLENRAWVSKYVPWLKEPWSSVQYNVFYGSVTFIITFIWLYMYNPPIVQPYEPDESKKMEQRSPSWFKLFSWGIVNSFAVLLIAELMRRKFQ